MLPDTRYARRVGIGRGPGRSAIRIGPVGIGFGLAVAGLAIAGLGGLVLAWDGAWTVVRTAETGMPTFLHGRVSGWLVQAPVLLVRPVTDDPAILTAVAGLSFASVPLLALAAAWRITRPDRDDLLALAFLGIGLAGLAGLGVLISEAMMAVALAWPLLLAAALGRLARHRLLVALLLLVIAGLHPFAVPIVGLAGVAVVLRAAEHPDERPVARRTVVVLGAIWALLVVRYLAFGSGYEGEALDLERLGAHWRGAVAGRPLVAILIAWALGVLVVTRPWRDRTGTVLAAAGTAAAIGVMVVWAADPERWQRALMFRTWAPAAIAPLLGLAVVAALAGRRRGAPRATDRPTGSLVVAGVGLVMFVVLVAQTLAWRSAVDALRADLGNRPGGCVEATDLAISGTPLDHWGITSLGLAVDGQAPRHLVAYGASCATVDAERGLPLKFIDGIAVDRAPVHGWLDLASIAASLAAHAEIPAPGP